MNLLMESGLTQCMKFYTIPDDCTVYELGPEVDLFVSAMKELTLTIPNGQTCYVRDVVVLGTLTIQSKDAANTALKGSLVARDMFLPGETNLTNIEIKCRNYYQPQNIDKFNSELEDVIFLLHRNQKETVRSMGLKSILT